jgi:mannose-6-phosphate isomerase-like protein (cupin superfamily)
MSAIKFSELQSFDFPGIVHQTIASKALGARDIEIWRQSIAPQAETPVHLHDCEEVVVVLQGSGRVMMDGKNIDFTANSTLLIPPDTLHQIINTGSEEMLVIGCFNASPVAAYGTDGEKIALPW